MSLQRTSSIRCRELNQQSHVDGRDNVSELTTQLLTLEEANSRIPLVASIIRDVVELSTDASERRERLERLQTRSSISIYSEEVQQMEQQLAEDSEKLKLLRAELEDIGADLEDPIHGIVGFRSIVNGQEAWLCWEPGQSEIGWWFELDANYLDRQPLGLWDVV